MLKVFTSLSTDRKQLVTKDKQGREMIDEEMAEEYATRECCMTCKNINHFCKEKCECWTFAKKGAEFGYIKGNEQLAKAKELIKKLVHEFYYLCELHNFATDYECLAEAGRFLNSEVLDDK